MPELLLLDTSAALRMLFVGDEGHEVVAARVQTARLGLAGHAAFETFSTLTRRPPPYRVAPRTAAELLRRTFPETRFPSSDAHAALLGSLAERGIAGGAVFDALVALAAVEHDATLLSADRRAASTYRAVGARFELL